MKIWIDDVRDAPDGFVLVRNLNEFISLLLEREEKIELISFDHDLGDSEPTGLDIAKWLSLNMIARWPEKVEVHSMNPVGAMNIREYCNLIERRH